MGPVDATSTSSGAQPMAAAAAFAVADTAAAPSGPVHALAFPLFTTRARTAEPSRDRHHATGAAAAEFFLNVAAHGRSVGTVLRVFVPSCFPDATRLPRRLGSRAHCPTRGGDTVPSSSETVHVLDR